MIVSIFHLPPTDTKPYVMVPVGYFYNREYYKLKKGDKVKFLGERTAWEYVDRLEIDIESAAFNFWCQTLYSCNGKYKVTKESIFKRWHLQAVRAGYDTKAVSDSRCLIIEVKK